MQSEDEGKTTEGLLAAAEIGDVLPALLGRHDAEEDALGEGVEAVDELELGVAAHGDHLVHFLEPQRDGAEARHEAFQPERAQVVVPFLGRVARAERGAEVGGARVVFAHAPSVVADDAEVDGRGLRAFFERGDGAFEHGLVEVVEFVFGVEGEVVRYLFGIFAQVAVLC